MKLASTAAVPWLLVAALAAGCATAGNNDQPDGSVFPQPDAAQGTPDAAQGTPDAAQSTPDAAQGTPDAMPMADAAPGTPDAMSTPDAMGTPDAGTPDAMGTPDAGCTNTITQILVNAGFDSGPGTGWVENGGGYDIILSTTSTPDPFPFTPDTPAYAAWMGGADSSTQSLYQDVAIPANAIDARLSWKQVIGTQETTTVSAYDTMSVTLRNTGNTVLETLASFSNLDAGTTTTWLAQGKTLTGSYAGQTVRVYFEESNDISNPSNFFVDSVALDVTVCQ